MKILKLLNSNHLPILIIIFLISFGVNAEDKPVDIWNINQNKIEKNHELKKYEWQKPHQANLTGTDKAYYPNKNKNAIKKKYKSWKN